eukprot:CAMPEP_0206490860 /NCGR_PEP_ID=MMETSP0324_2-20121206/44459_1 /ASSEMBLY_ACC=CAM_ASM_000836 /TAXON_ID=2866 /ORGANISM="Crypthecodinium cohnii, Strain Seligo" /LENGTH=77 /DNA_ID=CAMNT_0053971555 /DNA_START=74 /DNA_END=307 /DNA_ORIENTATION=+
MACGPASDPSVQEFQQLDKCPGSIGIALLHLVNWDSEHACSRLRLLVCMALATLGGLRSIYIVFSCWSWVLKNPELD